MRRKKLGGKRFGRWRVILDDDRMDVLCRCDCGVERFVYNRFLIEGRTRSCGCVRIGAAWNRTHGEAGRPGERTKEYRAWSSMKRRCSNERTADWKDYGGRGIRVCARWLRSYEAFLADMGRAPSPSHSLDRIDPNGNYRPGNVRWSTARAQARNHRRTRWVRPGVSLAEEAERAGVSASVLSKRLRRGWTIDEAVSGKRANPPAAQDVAKGAA
jgi:hypothetical protein